MRGTGETLIHKGYGYNDEGVSDLTSAHWVLGEAGGHLAGIVADHTLVHTLARPLLKVGQKVWHDIREAWEDNRDVIEDNREDFRGIIDDLDKLIEEIRGFFGFDKDPQGPVVVQDGGRERDFIYRPLDDDRASPPNDTERNGRSDDGRE